MTELYQNKFRIAPARLTGWDYTSAGIYFVTICTNSKMAWFGQVKNGKMELTGIGQIAQIFWWEITDHFENVLLA